MAAIRLRAGASYFLLLWSFAAVLLADESLDGVQVSVRVGIQNHWDAHFLTTVNIELSGSTSDFTGDLVVRTNPVFRRPDEYRYAIELPRGARRRFDFPMRLRGSEIVVSLEKGEESYFSQAMPLPPAGVTTVATERVDRVLFVSERIIDLENLGRSLASPKPRKISRGDPLLPETVSVQPADLPTSPPAYNSFRLVILFGDGPLTISERARSALEQWVRHGGNLVAFPGPNWSAGIPEGWQTLLGLDRVEALDEENGRRRLSAHLDAKIIGQGFAVRHHLDLGNVTTFARTPSNRAFPGRGNNRRLYRELDLAYQRGLSFASSYDEHLLASRNRSVKFVESKSSHVVPSSLRVAWTLLLYIFVAVFLPLRLFRKRKQPEYGYLVAVGLAVLTSAALYRFGTLGSVDSLSAESLTLLRGSLDSDQTRASSLIRYLSPVHDRLQVSPKMTGFRLSSSSRDTVGEQARYRVSESGSMVEESRLRPNEGIVRLFQHDVDTSEWIRVGRFGAKFRIQNLSNETLQLAFCSGESLRPLPDLAPFKDRELSTSQLKPQSRKAGRRRLFDLVANSNERLVDPDEKLADAVRSLLEPTETYQRRAKHFKSRGASLPERTYLVVARNRSTPRLPNDIPHQGTTVLIVEVSDD